MTSESPCLTCFPLAIIMYVCVCMRARGETENTALAIFACLTPPSTCLGFSLGDPPPVACHRGGHVHQVVLPDRWAGASGKPKQPLFS